MDYRLRKPCENCPFRSDGQGVELRPARVDEIEMHLTMGPFACHKTVDYAEAEWDDDESYSSGGMANASHCAGALILLEKLEQPHQMMRIAERIGLYDPDALDMEAPVWDSWEDMRYHMEEAGDMPQTEEICRVCDNWMDECRCVQIPQVVVKMPPPPPPPRRTKR